MPSIKDLEVAFKPNHVDLILYNALKGIYQKIVKVKTNNFSFNRLKYKTLKVLIRVKFDFLMIKRQILYLLLQNV